MRHFIRTLFVRWIAVQLLKVLRITSAPALIGVVGNEKVRKFQSPVFLTLHRSLLKLTKPPFRCTAIKSISICLGVWWYATDFNQCLHWKILTESLILAQDERWRRA